MSRKRKSREPSALKTGLYILLVLAVVTLFVGFCLYAIGLFFYHLSF